MHAGCTKEACALRDVANEPSFTRSDSTPAFRIVGISSDPVDKLKQFEQKYDLPYTLLSDWNQDARKAYGVNGTRLFGIAPGESGLRGKACGADLLIVPARRPRHYHY